MSRLDEGYVEVDTDVLKIVDRIEEVLDGVYEVEDEEYLPLDFNED